MGDLPAPTTPSAKLTPAVRAQEALGWRLGVEAYTFHKFTFFDAIDETAALGLCYIGGLSSQPVSKELPRNFDPSLSDEELAQIRLKLDAAGLRLLTYYIQEIPGDEAGCRKVFEFGRKLGIETFISEPKVGSLGLIEKFCDEYGISVALHNRGRAASPRYWNPQGVLEACRGRSKRIGACPDIGDWLRSGIDPVEGARLLGNRLITVQLHDLDKAGPDGKDVPWGAGAGRTRQFLAELRRLGLKPTMIGLEYSPDSTESMPQPAQCVEFFNNTTLSFPQ